MSLFQIPLCLMIKKISLAQLLKIKTYTHIVKIWNTDTDCNRCLTPHLTCQKKDSQSVTVYRKHDCHLGIDFQPARNEI